MTREEIIAEAYSRFGKYTKPLSEAEFEMLCDSMDFEEKKRHALKVASHFYRTVVYDYGANICVLNELNPGDETLHRFLCENIDDTIPFLTPDEAREADAFCFDASSFFESDAEISSEIAEHGCNYYGETEMKSRPFARMTPREITWGDFE
ncbi:MAG: hypothetical protein IJ489_10250 [Clostridia bacterium]|nr:hypothetical protein [Clostridia bacterium]